MILFPALLFVFSTAFSQSEPLDPAYKRFPTVPAFTLLLTDSSTLFKKDDLKKNQSTMIILFSPDCDHCKQETEDIIKHIDDFKNINIVMATMLPFEKMKAFYDHYRLDRFENIKVGYDKFFILPSFYEMKSFPFVAFYDKKKSLISVFDGNLPVAKMLEQLEKKGQ
jgi:thioredoxin-related protein